MKKLDSSIHREILEMALVGLEVQRAQTIEKIKMLRKSMGRASAVTAPAEGDEEEDQDEQPKEIRAAEAPRKGRTLSAAARRRIGAAQKRRWAEYKKNMKGRKRAA